MDFKIILFFLTISLFILFSLNIQLRELLDNKNWSIFLTVYSCSRFRTFSGTKASNHFFQIEKGTSFTITESKIFLNMLCAHERLSIMSNWVYEIQFTKMHFIGMILYVMQIVIEARECITILVKIRCGHGFAPKSWPFPS